MTQTVEQIGVQARTATRLATGLAWLALATVIALAMLLSIRKMASPDIGYHLAYGEEFWRTGKPVDHNPYIFTLTDDRPDQTDLAPGCWYDSQGRYRFPNANWGTQVVMAAVNTWFGPIALSLLLPAMVAGVIILILLTLRRFGAGPLTCAAAMLLVTMTAHERFMLRPEMFGYLILVAQMYILVGWQSRVRQVIVLGLLQVLLVNFHSYFMLGLAITTAYVIDAAVRRVLAWINAAVPESNLAGRRLKMLLITLGVQLIACLVNPWTWRLAALPVQTLVFMKENHIAGQYHPGAHPWSIIGEFFSPFSGFANIRATISYLVLLAVAAAAIVLAVVTACLILWRRQTDATLKPKRPGNALPGTHGQDTPTAQDSHTPLLAWALIIAGMVAISFSMRRNIAPAAMVIVPLAVGIFIFFTRRATRLQALLQELRASYGWWQVILTVVMRKVITLYAYMLAIRSRLEQPKAARWWRLAALAVPILIAYYAGQWSYQATTDRFYFDERTMTRFGLGFSPIDIPLGASDFVSEHLAAPGASNRVWCDLYCSSNVYYFTNPHRDVPLVTNTWAYPPHVMKMVLDAFWVPGMTDRPLEFEDLHARYGFDAVLLRVDPHSWALTYTLARSDAWAVAYVDARFVVFVRRDGAYAKALLSMELNPKRLDMDRLLQKADAQDPSGASGLFMLSLTLHALGWTDPAVDAINQAIQRRPDWPEAHNRLGQLLADHANKLMDPKVKQFAQARELLEKAVKAFEKSVSLRGDYAEAQQNLDLARSQLADLKKNGMCHPVGVGM